MKEQERKTAARYLTTMKYGEGLRYLQKILRRNTSDPDALRYAALFHDQRAATTKEPKGSKKDFQKALEYAQKGLKVSPRDHKLLHVQDVIFLHTKQPRRALIAYRQAFRLSGGQTTYFLSIGNAYRKIGKIKRALWWYRRALKNKSGQKELTLYNITYTYLAAKNIAAAKRAASQFFDTLKKKQKLTPFDLRLKEDIEKAIH